jgi:hypothetical protein
MLPALVRRGLSPWVDRDRRPASESLNSPGEATARRSARATCELLGSLGGLLHAVKSKQAAAPMNQRGEKAGISRHYTPSMAGSPSDPDS